MLIRHYQSCAPDTEVPGVKLHAVIGPDDGARRFTMRVFEVEPGAGTPFHSHWWEHEVFILSGAGVVRAVDGERPLQPEQAVFVQGYEQHCFINTGDVPLRFICVVPADKTAPPPGEEQSPTCDVAPASDQR